MKTVELKVQLPIGDAMASLGPEIDILLAQRLAELRTRHLATRSLGVAVERAINNVTRAITRVENAHQSRDEKPALAALIAAAKGLRRARATQKQAKG
jgi:hypothetical protein